MRIISGEFRGRILRAPPGRATRPTQGHVRQVLFDIIGEAVQGKRVLDLFAGSGALGIEALSRGAAAVSFIEHSSAVLRCLRQNLEALDLGTRGRILAAHVNQGVRVLEDAGASFEWILADPPYRLDPEEWMPRLARSGPGGLLARDGTLVLETSRRSGGPAAIAGLRRRRSHRVGETTLEFYGWEEREDETKGDLSGNV